MKRLITSFVLMLYVTNNENISSETILQHGLLTVNTLKIYVLLHILNIMNYRNPGKAFSLLTKLTCKTIAPFTIVQTQCPCSHKHCNTHNSSLLLHCEKCILSNNDRICDSVLIQANMGQSKPVFWHILRSAIITHFKIKQTDSLKNYKIIATTLFSLALVKYD